MKPEFFLGGGGGVVSTLYTIPLDQSEHRILLLFSDIVSAVISNACRTALALEFMYLYSDSRDLFPVWCLPFTKSFAWLTFA